MKVARIDGNTIAPGLAESSVPRNTITPSGSTATPDVLIARNSAIELVDTPGCGLSFSSSLIAFRPNGVAAFPRPSMFDAMFRIIAPIAG